MPTKKIYDPCTQEFIPVSDEVYTAYYQPVWRQRKALQRAGKCLCPANQLWKCVGDCQNCSHYADGNTLSLDKLIEQHDDFIPDSGPELDDVVADQMLYSEALKQVEEEFPEAIQIGFMRLAGLTDREIAEKLGIPKSTFRSRLEKLHIHLEADLEISF